MKGKQRVFLQPNVVFVDQRNRGGVNGFEDLFADRFDSGILCGGIEGNFEVHETILFLVLEPFV